MIVFLKKFGFVFVAILALIGLFLGVMLLRRRGGNQITTATNIVEDTKLKMDQVEITAQLKRAEAAHIEEAKVNELREIKEIKDSKERRRRIAALL
jgi:regulatory protein YycI of two-component signal transduction system YycFG